MIHSTHSDPLVPSLNYGGIFGTRSDPILQGGVWFIWYKWQWQSVLTLSPGLSHNLNNIGMLKILILLALMRRAGANPTDVEILDILNKVGGDSGFITFLAPTGAQEMLFFVCPSEPNLSRAHNLHLLASDFQDDFSMTSGFIEHSDSTEKALREHLKSHKRAFRLCHTIGASEPKM